ncbi:MAG: linear amide C-N hydrolase [Burkholderiales bacterium]|nr:linear amide C-N hydrolase [Burkholderiales bacterium]
MCNTFVVKAKNGKKVVGSDMQYGNMVGNILGRMLKGISLNGITSTIDFNAFFSDFNIAGKHVRTVSMGYSEYLVARQWFRDTSFNNALTTKDNQISGLSLLQFILGNAKSIDETKKLLEGKQLTLPLEILNQFGTVQIFLYDIAKDKSVVINFVEKDGKQGIAKYTELPGHVITNMPDAEYHIKNLGAFVNYADSVESVTKVKEINGYPVEFTGLGNAWKGIPSSATPEDRFVSLNLHLDAALKHSQPKDSKEALLLVSKVLEKHTVIEGTVCHSTITGKSWDKTQWLIMIDLETGTTYRKMCDSFNYEIVDFPTINIKNSVEPEALGAM